ncbi:MAG: LpqB family beta-propeller domain-containing protein [Nocardioides sp.]|nr:LpqB family beta-propeller domain-containing protein [Nocardioides sp.]
MTRPVRERRWAGAGALLAGCLLSGCLSLPEVGPVVEAGTADEDVDLSPMYIDPLPPRTGDSPAQVVKGFLDAMLATPQQTTVAREFLSSRSRDSWNPQQTITFAAADPPSGNSQVAVDVTDAHLIDARGAWQGDLGDRTFEFGMVREAGEYRIATPPDALIVPERWYEPRFRQVSLYFFDPTGTILVPEPAFVPVGEQLASTLVRGLIEGPPGVGGGLATSFFPPGLTAGLSVPVSSDGVADIALSGGTGPVTREQAELLLAQLTSTLRQDPAIGSVRLSIDGLPVGLPGSATEVGLDRGESFAPYVASSSRPLYGLRDGVLVSGNPGTQQPVSGPFGTTMLGVRSIAPDLVATTAAGISGDGTAVLLGPVRNDGPVTQVVSGATDLLVPTWDFSGRLWLVDRTAEGARILSRQGEVSREVVVPGISGGDVRRVLVSRDGSRLVAVVRAGGSDTVVVSRVLHDEAGRVIAVTPAIRIDDEADVGVRIRDLAWRTPTSLALLTSVTDDLQRVRGLNVDGAPGGLGGLLTTVKGDLRSLVGSPAPGQSLYAEGPGILVPLTVRTDGPLPLNPAVADVFYAG